MAEPHSPESPISRSATTSCQPEGGKISRTHILEATMESHTSNDFQDAVPPKAREQTDVSSTRRGHPAKVEHKPQLIMETIETANELFEQRRSLTSPDMESTLSGWSPTTRSTLPVRATTIPIPKAIRTQPPDETRPGFKTNPFSQSSRRTSVSSGGRVEVAVSETTASHFCEQDPEGQEGTGSVHAQLANERKGLESYRRGIAAHKLELQKMKQKLKHRDDELSVEEDHLLKKLTLAALVHSEGYSKPSAQVSIILELKTMLQSRRSELGPLEDDCSKLDSRISLLESQAQELEQNFVDNLQKLELSSISLQPLTSERNHSDSESIEDDVEDDVNISYHPLVEQYLSLQGDLDILLERLAEIMDERDDLEDQQAVRATVNHVLGPDEQEWLDASGALISDLELQIDKLEIEVEERRLECFAKGLVDAEGDPIELAAQEDTFFTQETDLTTGSEISDYMRYPTLLPQPLVRPDQDEQEEQQSSVEELTTGARICAWLLDRLRDSALEVNLLARTYDMEAKGKESTAIWQVAVLKLWYEDDTVRNNAQTGTVKTVDSQLTRDRPISWHSFGDASKNTHLFLGIRSLQSVKHVSSELTTEGKQEQRKSDDRIIPRSPG
jgi:hypothetical protein